LREKKVLVVDDEPSVLRFVAGALSRKGYEVHAVPHPHHALELVKASDPCFDVIVSDVIMPDMSGRELVKNVKRMSPRTGVVLMSAHMASEALPEYAAFINKPFRITDLFSIVEKVLPDSGPRQTFTSAES
jgi:two-component system cell cycle sensor histidine kinase/response regulator CckA